MPASRRASQALRDRLEAEILAAAPAARIFGRGAARLPNTSCLAMPGVSNQTQLIAFDLAGIAVSTGSACSSGKVGPSHVLAAMGAPPDAGGLRDPHQPRLGEHGCRRRPPGRRLDRAARPYPRAPGAGGSWPRLVFSLRVTT